MGASTTTLLGVTAVVIISLMVIGMLIAQGRHKSMAAKKELLQNLLNQQRKLNNLLRGMPVSFLSPELRDFIYQALLQNIKAQIPLTPDKAKLLEEDFQELAQERARIRKKPPSAVAPRLSSEETNLHRQTLKSLFLFIKRNYDSGRLNKSDADKLLSQVEYKLVETALDYFKSRADLAMNSKHYREARVAYQKAIDTIATSRQASLFKQEEIELRTRLQQIIDAWREDRKSQTSGQAEKLAAEMEGLIDEQDSWKKKNVYD
jgi:hypothetical protein